MWTRVLLRAADSPARENGARGWSRAPPGSTSCFGCVDRCVPTHAWPTRSPALRHRCPSLSTRLSRIAVAFLSGWSRGAPPRRRGRLIAAAASRQWRRPALSVQTPTGRSLVHRVPSCPGMRGTSLPRCRGRRMLSLGMRRMRSSVTECYRGIEPRTSGRRLLARLARRIVDQAHLRLGVGRAALASRRTAGRAAPDAPDADTAFSSPPRPVDFSADVAASVRR